MWIFAGLFGFVATMGAAIGDDPAGAANSGYFPRSRSDADRDRAVDFSFPVAWGFSVRLLPVFLGLKHGDAHSAYIGLGLLTTGGILLAAGRAGWAARRIAAAALASPIPPWFGREQIKGKMTSAGMFRATQPHGAY